MKQEEFYRIVVDHDIKVTDPLNRAIVSTKKLKITSMESLKKHNFNINEHAKVSLSQHVYCQKCWNNTQWISPCNFTVLPITYYKLFYDFGKHDVEFYIMDKLQYADDVRQELINRHLNLDSFKPTFWQKLRPIVITQASEFGDIKWRNLDRHDIVVDRDFKQIWPRKTGKYPTALQILFNSKEGRKTYE